MSNKFLFFGYGYVAKYLLSELKRNNDNKFEFFGTSRSVAEQNYKDISIYKCTNNYHLENPEEFFCGVTHILISIPNTDFIFDAYAKYMKDVVWIGYLSSTGVYGNHNGRKVFENSPLLAKGEHGLSRIKNEKIWMDSGLPVNIFRLSGIYGPGNRNRIHQIMSGNCEIIHKEGTIFSRIHVDDIVNILIKSINIGKIGEIYNCADDIPASTKEVNGFIANLLNISEPKCLVYEEVEQGLSDFVRHMYNDRKIVDNTKIKEDLGIELIHKSYKYGMISIVKSGDFC